MQSPAKPANEAQRLAALGAYAILDTPVEVAFDSIARLAAIVLQVPIALISIVDADRQWFKARYGLSAQETPREVSFCGHVVATGTPLVVPDATMDVRFADNPLVVGDPAIRFYAGMPLTTPDTRRLVFGWLGSPNRRAFRSAMGRAPMVKTSRMMPPTPVAAPW